jgi:uncharacterized integral membrane protein (TIGR00698 family)
MKAHARLALFATLALASLTPWVTAPMALLAGVAFAFVFGNPYATFLKRWTSPLLQTAVVGLGAGMNLAVVLKTGARGLGYTALGIVFTLLLARLLAGFLKTDPVISLLIGVGTAICGGSAIAAVAPVIRAKGEQTSVALGVVFLLNSAALLIFPRIGALLALSPGAFGLWAALAIHDTSSVVGAALSFAPDAVAVATTVKLARALWIVPVALWAAQLPLAKTGEGPRGKTKRPWFLLGFVAAAALATYVPGMGNAGATVAALGRHLLVLTLFFVGATLSRNALRAVGWRPFVLGLSLWMVVATATLGAVRAGWIAV